MSDDRPINHDGISTVATVGYKAAKWGLLGAVAAFAIPAVGGLLLAGVAATAIGGGLGAIAATLIGGAGIALGIGAGVSYGGVAAAGGGLIGAIKGGAQVSRENHAYATRHHSHANQKTRELNDREIRGVQQGYQLAMHDMEPMVQQREMAAYQQGQEAVVKQIQEKMEAGAKAAGATAEASQQKTGKFGDKELALKCESKAQAILKERDMKEMAPKQLGA